MLQNYPVFYHFCYFSNVSILLTIYEHDLYEVEKIFRIETSGSQHISKIDITSMTTILCKNPSIVSHFENIVGEYEECELIQGLLHSMIQLYLRVRSFSLAKDITSKYKQQVRLKKSKGSLRKNMKNLSSESK